MEQLTTKTTRFLGIPIIKQEVITSIDEAKFKARLEKILEEGIDTNAKLNGSLRVEKGIIAGEEIRACDIPQHN